MTGCQCDACGAIASEDSAGAACRSCGGRGTYEPMMAAKCWTCGHAASSEDAGDACPVCHAAGRAGLLIEVYA